MQNELRDKVTEKIPYFHLQKHGIKFVAPYCEYYKAVSNSWLSIKKPELLSWQICSDMSAISEFIFYWEDPLQILSIGVNPDGFSRNG